MPDEKINEVERFVVKLPRNRFANPAWHERSFVAFTRDEVGGDTRYSMVTNESTLCSFDWQYSVFGSLCSDRAQRTVDGSLVVNGKVVLPETYLRLWRLAFKQPLFAEDLAKTFGVALIGFVEAPLEKVRDARCGHAYSPFATFAEFEAAYGSTFLDLGAGRFRVEFDFCSPGVAWGAWDSQYAALIMSTAAYDGRIQRDEWKSGAFVRVLDSNGKVPDVRIPLDQQLLFAGA